MDERRLELRVALLLLAALASGGVLLYLVGAFRGAGDQPLHVDFGHSGGVPAGAPVKLAGVEVGRVRAVELLPARRDARGLPLPVRMDLTVRADVLAALHADARVGMAFQGALGEPYLELGPGSAAAPALTAGAELRGIDPPRLDLLLAKVEDLINVAHAFLGDATQRDQMAGLMKTAGDLARTADQLLLENKDSIPELLHELSATAKDAKEVLAESKALLAGNRVGGLVDDARALTTQLRTEVPPLTADAKVLLQSGKNLAGDFTPKDGAELKAALARAEAASAKLEGISARADALLTQLEAGKGTVGGLYQDPTVYQDLKALLHDLREHPVRTLTR